MKEIIDFHSLIDSNEKEKNIVKTRKTLRRFRFLGEKVLSSPMEVSGTVLRQVTCPSLSRHVPSRGAVPGGGGGGCVRVSVRPRTVVMGCSSGFSDEGHLQYYDDKKKKGTTVLSIKKKLKMVKGLSKGLSLFPEFGFALDSEKQALFDDLQGNLTSDAAEVLMKQLEQLRADEKELKRKRKQEKKAKLKASKMNTVPDCESSSSSSESSDSDCDDEVVDMNNLRVGVAVAPSTTVDDGLQPPSLEATMLSSPALLPPKTATIVENPPEDASAHHHDAMELCSRNDDTCVSSISGGLKSGSAVVITAPSQKRIEVCLGNKCKRSGAAALLQEFERVVGVEGGAVVGCKCMGKCKSGPNVRIQNSVDGLLAEGLNDSVKVPANPLLIGVGLEDVETIVARFLGENQEDMGMAAAAT